ncbi:MAG: hypothetical protein E7240_09850 [Lachnospiraceae bacterium]|nr:hypothetical protein [Lachnospiraceae bacterium]
MKRKNQNRRNIKQNLTEWFSIQYAKNPGKVVLATILIFNIVFFVLSAFIISSLALKGTEKMGFFEAAFYTISMILDAGCISYVIEDIGQSGVVIAVICLLIVMIGMVSFTGAVIGYITNAISNIIENADNGKRKLSIKDHLVILNWNSRASEIINDLLYCDGTQKVVVLVNGRKAEIEKEVNERVADTIDRENKAILKKTQGMKALRRFLYFRKNHMKNNLIVIVREGDVFSAMQLHDICLEKARSCVILGNDINNTLCKFETKERLEELSRGNSHTLKTLMQVADITAADYSDDNQKIIVEITDDWTWELVDRVIKYKQNRSKCNIVPVRVNTVLGQILSQFSLMPELNLAYRELFSNKGATFDVREEKILDENTYITRYLRDHNMAIPLTSMHAGGRNYFFYSTENERDISRMSPGWESVYKVKLNHDYWIEPKTVIILGHNSKCHDIMLGFKAFCAEWGYEDPDRHILNIVVIDDRESLEKMNYYREFPFVTKTVPANIYEEDIICGTIEKVVTENAEDTSILILSDDSARNEDIDANALANLVYVQDIIRRRLDKNPKFDPETIDIIVEIIDPKHHDVVSSYSVDNVVISNRYISKMITQIGEKEAIFDFYCDILTYDAEGVEEYESKEVYAKKVSTFFEEVPAECTAEELIRAVWDASIDKSIPKEKQYPTIVLGYVKPGGKIHLFAGDQSKDRVKLTAEDKIIVFTNH